MEQEGHRRGYPKEAIYEASDRHDGYINMNELERERQYLYLLNCLPQITNRKISQMYEASGSFEQAYERESSEYKALGIFRDKTFEFEARRSEKERLLYTYEGFLDRGIRLVSFMDEDYPKRLRGLPDAPLLLYVRGSLPKEEGPMASVIGSRSPSGYGLHAAGFISGELSHRGAVIISGMALGIDSCSQRKALKEGYKSFAVLGGGVDKCYPRESRDIYELMCDGQGGVISEFPPWTEPDSWRFVSRNRIIAGLSDAVIVAEARKRSGTSITVDYALSYGREVFAVPHRLCDTFGEGCNALIRDGAHILCDMEELYAVLGLSGIKKGRKGKEKGPELASFEKIVYSWLDFNERHVEEIAELSGLTPRETELALFKLSLKGLAYAPQASYYRKA